MKKLIILLAFILTPALAVTGNALASYHEKTVPKPEMTAEETMPAEVEATLGDDGVQRAEIVSPKGFTFSPKWVTVKVGIPVELTMKKTSFMVPHRIVAEDEDAGVVFDIKLKRKAKTVTFTPTEVGEYVFYCSTTVPFLKNHRERGMEGIIEVVE